MTHMTKEELREDPVLEWIQHAVQWTQQNVRWVALGAAAVVVVIIAGVMISRGREKSEMEAQQLLTAGQAYFLQGNAAGAEAQLRQLISQHGGSDAAAGGRIYLGDVLAGQGRYDEALTVYREAAGAAGLLGAAARRGQAAALESLQRLAEASQAYEEAAREKTSFQADDLVAAARCALQAGDAQRAKTLLDRARELNVASTQAMIGFYTAQAEAALPR